MSQTNMANEYTVHDKVAQDAIRQKFLAFKLGKKEYAIRSATAKGLCNYESVVSLFDAPEFLVGAIHYDGVIAPVIDLRLQCDRTISIHDTDMRVLMLTIAGHLIGMVVNNVSGIISLTEDQIKPAPRTIHAYDNIYLTDIGSMNEREIHLIHSDRLMSYVGRWFLLEKAAA
ncbi:MAG: chemotaxis protein CheW [Burkholderiaceae bacterium]